jgi:ribulose-5-phosphate 4-epimerase/fuculose-1-phosphate aldolase
MQTVDPAVVSEFVDACRRVEAMGLMKCSSGNLSCRLDEDRMLISGSRTWLGEIRDDQVALCRISDASPINDVRPSVETGFHAGILRTRTDINVVLHFQSPFATTLACGSPEKIDFNVSPEIPYYIGTVGYVPFFTPGTPELAKAVIAAQKDNDMVILQNHGLVTVGVDYHDALQKAVFFELACRVIVQGGESVKRLPAEAALALRGQRGTGRAV